MEKDNLEKDVNPLMSERLLYEMKRKGEGMNQSKLALYSGVNKTDISKYLSKARAISFKSADKFAKYFGVRREYILCEDDYRTEEERLAHVNGAIQAAAVLNVGKDRAYNAIFFDQGISEHIEHGIKTGENFITISEFKCDGSVYYISSEQKERIIDSIGKMIKSQFLMACDLLKQQNNNLKEIFMDRIKEYGEIDHRPIDEILKEAESIRNNPDTERIEF